MNRISEKFANVLGSVGIAALAIAVLLVPYSDLNAAVSSAGGTPCNITCSPGVKNGKCGCFNGGCTPAPPCPSCTSTTVIVIPPPPYPPFAICYCSCPASVP